MSNKCPYCKASFVEGAEHLKCPYCGEELPKNSNKEADYNSLKPDDTNIKFNNNYTNRKSFAKAYADYETNRAYLNMHILPIIGAIILVISIIGIFFNIYFVVGLFISALLFLGAFLSWLVYKYHTKNN